MRCQALDNWGLRCKAKAIAKPQTIHADSELTSYDSLYASVGYDTVVQETQDAWLRRREILQGC
jgi:hypothetical protein